MSELNVPGAKLYYETYGQGPPVIVVPASSGAVDTYRPMAQDLAADFTVVIFDRRGFSRSHLLGAQDYEHRMERDADDVRCLIDHLDAGPAVVFGNSSGALVSLAALTRHPEAIATVVAHEAPVMTAWPGGQAWIDRFHALYDMYRRVGPHPTVSQFQRQTFADSDIATMAAVMNPAKDPYVVGNANYWFERELRQYPAYVFDYDTLTEHARKLVLLNGVESRGYACYEATAALGTRVGARVIEMVGGHTAHLAVAFELARAVKDAASVEEPQP